MEFPANPVKLLDCQLNWEYLTKLFKVVESTSTTVQGPGVISTDVIYTTVEVSLAPGTWIVYGCASMSSQAATDGKALQLYNQTNGAVIPNTLSPVQDTPALNAVGSYTTWGVLTLTNSMKIRLIGRRNGASQITIGTALLGGSVQRITAIQVK